MIIYLWRALSNSAAITVQNQIENFFPVNFQGGFQERHFNISLAIILRFSDGLIDLIMSKKAYSVLQLSQNQTLAKLLCPDPPRACLDDGCSGSVTVSASLKNSPALFCVGLRTYIYL